LSEIQKDINEVLDLRAELKEEGEELIAAEG